MLAEGLRGQGVLVPADEGLANDCVGGGVHNGNVGDTIVRGTDVDLHLDLLARLILLNLAVVGERNALALPQAAVWVRALQVLSSTLDVAVVVGKLVVVDLVATGSLETQTGHADIGRSDIAVGGNGRGKACNSDSDGVSLHCGGVGVGG